MGEGSALRRLVGELKWIPVLFLLCFSQFASATASKPSTLQSISSSPRLSGRRSEGDHHRNHALSARKCDVRGVAATILSSGTTFIDVVTPPHAAGAVNVTVVNSGGFQTVLTNGYTYTIAVTTSSLPDGIAAISYSQTFGPAAA